MCEEELSRPDLGILGGVRGWGLEMPEITPGEAGVAAVRRRNIFRAGARPVMGQPW